MAEYHGDTQVNGLINHSLEQVTPYDGPPHARDWHSPVVEWFVILIQNIFINTLKVNSIAI